MLSVDSQEQIQRDTRHNFTVNVMDGAFFGLGLGFASSVTVIPLFLNSLTSSTLLIGLLASLHGIGWQLPQLFTSGYVMRLRRYKPMVMMGTLHERWPFFGLMILALMTSVIGPNVVVAFTVIFLATHSLSGGIAATAWQSMIGKIIPASRRGTFFGMQSGMANLLAAGGAFVAGVLIEQLPYPVNFAVCFALAGVAMFISYFFLWRTRESVHENPPAHVNQRPGWKEMKAILKRDGNFRWFLITRVLGQVAWASVSFYTIYAVREFNVDPKTAGALTSVLMLSQTLAAPILGFLGDRFGHRTMYGVGALLITASMICILSATSIGWFYLVFALAGFSQSAAWAVAMTFTLEFGDQHEKPLYIGMANTLIAPAALLAPILGGWLVDTAGFHPTFLVTTICGLLTAAMLFFVVADPHKQKKAAVEPVMKPSLEDSGVW